MKTKRLKHLTAFVIFVILVLIVWRIVSRGPVEIDSGYSEVMGTLARVLVVARDKEVAQRCIDAAFEQLYHIDKLMSAHNNDSEISRINRLASVQPVKLSPETFEVIERSIELSKLSNGAFDITVGPLIEMWREAAEVNTVPTETQVKTILQRVGYQKLLLDANDMTIHFAVEGMSLDLGGIAKGYAIDKAIEALKLQGAYGGMVEAGGDIRCFGTPAGRKTCWLVGLEDPNIGYDQIIADRPILVLKVSNAAVLTSGNYQRFIVIGGKRYNHIIDPRTGGTCEGLSSVTIITDNATDADALATAVSVLGLEDGLKLIDSLDGVEGILITAGPEYKMIFSKNARRYIHYLLGKLQTH